MKFLLGLFLVLPFVAFTQKVNLELPRDTSFSVWSAGQKISKDFSEAKAVAEVLNNAGINNKLISIPNTPHPFWLFHPWFDKTWPEILDFLKQVFNS